MATKSITCAICSSSFLVEMKRGGYPNTCSIECRAEQKQRKIRRYETNNRQSINERAKRYRSDNRPAITEREKLKYAADPTQKRTGASRSYKRRVATDPKFRETKRQRQRADYLKQQLISSFETLNGRPPTAMEIQTMLNGHLC
ncbi:hypothetical protein ACQR1I_36265 [Bradyrhizobium sp. HKCCYLS2038]|uniref:hypothetical protein n=1 Tax=Bradyrhizobium sp. HKCCYLS2038 TaxID=3420764 RepID=UPI003EBACB5F